MTDAPTGQDATHIAGDDSTHEPGDQAGEDKRTLTLDSPLAEEDVHTQEQRNQTWTQEGSPDPRREEFPPPRVSEEPAPTLDRPDQLEDKMDDIMANPHSDAEEGHDEEMGLGGVPKTGSGEQDPMRQAQGGQSGG